MVRKERLTPLGMLENFIKTKQYFTGINR
jgi:hypothetical protein